MPTTQKLKTLIKDKKLSICSCIVVSETLLSLLEGHRIITDEQHKKILKKDGNLPQNFALWSFVETARTDDDIDNISLALINSGNNEGAKIFQSLQTQKTLGQSSSKENNADLVASRQSDVVDSIYNPISVRQYPMDGRLEALIINVQKHRPGSEIDGPKLKETLEGCGFKVETCPDLTEKGTKKCIADFKLKMENLKKKGDLSCCFIAFMGHGKQGDILQLDGWGTLSIAKDGLQQFNNVKSNLIGIPKIFLVNMCRGKERDNGVEDLDDLDSYTEEIKDSVETDIKNDEDEEYSSPGDEDGIKVPSYSDMLVCYSTLEGFVSIRPAEGAWYVQEFCSTLENSPQEMHIEDVLKIVNDNVKDRENPRGLKQCAEFVNKGFNGKLFLKRRK